MAKDNETAVSAEDIAALTTQLKTINDQVMNVAEDVKTKMAAGQEVTTELKSRADKLLADQGGLREQIDKLKEIPEQIAGLDARAKDIEQKMARRRTGDERPDSEKSTGEIVVENEGIKAMMADGNRFRGRKRVDFKSITTADMAGLVVPDRVTATMLPHRPMTVRDLITQGRTKSNSIQFWQQTGFTNLARIQTESQTKGESTIAGQLVTANVATIAHFMIAPKQILEDAPQLQSEIDGELRYGLAYVEETQILTGDGDNGNLLGIVPQATAFSAPFTPDMYQRIDTVRVALLQAELALFPSSGVVMNNTDWARIETTKDGEGRYIFAQPQNESTPRLWGRSVVATPAMTLGYFLAGAFKLGAVVYDRQDAAVEISTEDSDNFRKNLVTIRAEERLALAVKRPEAFIYGAFPNVT